VTPVPFKHLQK
jgi:hypothetical protein